MNEDAEILRRHRHIAGRGRHREEDGAAEAGDRRGVVRVEELIAAELIGSVQIDLRIVGKRNVTEVDPDPPVVRSGPVGRVIGERIPHLESLFRAKRFVVAAPDEARKLQPPADALDADAFRRVLTDFGPDQLPRRRDLVGGESVLEPEVVQGASRENRGMADHDGAARNVHVVAGVCRIPPAACRRGTLGELVLLRVADEQALGAVQGVIDAERRQRGVPGLRERAFHRRVQVGPSRVHGEEVVLLRALDRREEVRPILPDRSAQAAAELVPAVVGLGLLEIVPGIERFVAEVFEHVSM